MIGDNLPALVVVTPLLGAILAPLLGRGARAWWLATAVCAAVLVLSGLLLERVLVQGTVSYALGGWAPPIGIEYRVDRLNALVLLIVAAISAVVTIFARLSVEREIAAPRVRFFYSAWLMCIAGLLGITITGDAFNLYVLLEISSISTYILVALGRPPQALRASFNYLILGTIGATFLLIGIGYLYLATGTLNMADLAGRLAGAGDNRTVRSAFAFIIVGASLKLALFPLHAWLPNAYTHAPSAVTALLAATSTKVGAYILLRFLFTIFGVELSFTALHADVLILVAAGVAVIAGSLVAIRQNNVKRMLAWSSIAQIGYIALGLGLASVTGLTAAILHLFNHALMKGALFLALGCVAYRLGSTQLSDFSGLARRMPWTFAAFTAGGLSLIGIPLTAGFISKWYLLQATIERGSWLLAAVVVIGSLLAVIYLWRVIEVAYFRPSSSAAARVREAPALLLIPTWGLVLGNLYFGIDTQLSADTAAAAARALLGTTGVTP